MKKTVRPLAAALWLTLFFLCFSCGSVPSQGEGPVPQEKHGEAPETVEAPDPRGIGEEPLPEAGEPSPEPEAAPPEETPPEVFSGGAPVSESPEYGDLPEPELNFAEAVLPDSAFPGEEAAIDSLPEPAPPLSAAGPVLPPEAAGSMPEPEPAPVPEPAPAAPAPAVSAPEPAPVAPDPAVSTPAPPVPAVPEPEPPPDPPRSLRPAEPLPPPEAAREKPPVPVNPVADLPPKTPQSVLQSPAETGEDIHFSRVVQAAVGQLVEIPFRGTGWVFLGELDARRGIAYGSRRLDPEGQSFIFRAEEAGAYALKFYKQDFIRDYILNDYVQVIVGEAPESPGAAYFNPPVDRGRVIAEPRWPLSLAGAPASGFRDLSAGTGALPENAPRTEGALIAEPGPERDRPPVPVPEETQGTAESRAPTGTPPAAGPQAGPPPVSAGPPPAAGPPASPAPPSEPGRDGSLPPGTSPEEYINRAREEYGAGRAALALSILDQFRETYPAGSDEAWWLYGQLLEANGPQRDIRSALDYYRRLIREYPQSTRYDEARRRIAYLERYYFNIQ